MTDVTLPDGSVASFPDEMAPAEITKVIQAHISANPQALGPQDQYRGSILPFSVNAQGQTQFDPNAGILGSIADAVKLPSEVVEGKQPVIGANGQVDPTLLNRSINLAQFAASQAPGETMPGQFRTQLGAPSAQMLRRAGAEGYNAIRNSGYEVGADAVQGLAQGLQNSLVSDHGIISENAPKTFAILDKLANPPSDPGTTVTVGFPAIQAARQGLRDVSMAGGPEGKAARTAIRAIDGFLESPPAGTSVGGTLPPDQVGQMFRDANANYAAAQRSNDLSGALDRGNTGIAEQAQASAHASHSGINLGNSIRQRVKNFLQNDSNLAGYSGPEIEALNRVVQGSGPQNAARYFGNFLGGGGGIGGLIAGSIGGHLLGGGTEGGMIGGAALPAIGYGLKSIDNAMALRGLNNVDNMIRSRAPLSGLLGNIYGPAMNRDQAVWKAILQGAMPQPQQPPGILSPGGPLA